MTKVTVFSVLAENGGAFYHAIAKGKESGGRTAGEALDALMAQLPEADAGTLVVIQSFKPDRFFNAAQQQRLAELIGRWRTVRDKGMILPTDEQKELKALVEAETRAAGQRIAALTDELMQ